jgi:hypothetical protein
MKATLNQQHSRMFLVAEAGLFVVAACGKSGLEPDAERRYPHAIHDHCESHTDSEAVLRA